MLMECGPSNCRFASCGNRQFAHAAAGGLENLTEVFWTGPRKGFGLRAKKHLMKNQLVAEYVGEISVISSIQNWRYIMSLPQGFAIDASMAGGPARFVNHSCEPNCNAQRWLVEGRWHVGIFATRDILPLEEITFSYSNGRSRGDGHPSSDPCHCGATSCTGRIAEPPKKYPRCGFANRTSKKMKATEKSKRNAVKNKKKQSQSVLKKSRRAEELEVPEPDVLQEMDSTPATEKTLECPFWSPEDDSKTDPKPNNCETEVVEVDEDIIEVEDEIDTHQNINQNRATEQSHGKPDEDETLQDLLSATKVHQGHGTFFDSRNSNHQEMHGVAGIISTWFEAAFDKEKPCQEDSIALSLGLYLPSALRRAMSSCSS